MRNAALLLISSALAGLIEWIRSRWDERHREDDSQELASRQIDWCGCTGCYEALPEQDDTPTA